MFQSLMNIHISKKCQRSLLPDQLGSDLQERVPKTEPKTKLQDFWFFWARPVGAYQHFDKKVGILL